jgi:hypothetical protein
MWIDERTMEFSTEDSSWRSGRSGQTFPYVLVVTDEPSIPPSFLLFRRRTSRFDGGSRR